MKSAILLATLLSSVLFAQEQSEPTNLNTTTNEGHTITIGHEKKELEPQEDLHKPFSISPYVLAELLLMQEAKYGADYGSIAPRDVEAGITVTYQDKLAASIVIALGDDYNIELNQAFINYAFTDNLHLSAGVVESGFGILEFNSLNYPLIYDDLEVIVPSIMVDMHGERIFGSIAMYQGVQTDNLLSFLPTFGVTLGDFALLKASGRFEFEDGRSYSDISLGLALTPADFIEIRSEFVTDLQDKDSFDDGGNPISLRMMGYFVEAGFFMGDNWLFAARYDDRISDYTVKNKEGIRAIEGSANYTVFEPFSVGLGVTFLQEYTETTSSWHPVVSLLAHFDI